MKTIETFNLSGPELKLYKRNSTPSYFEPVRKIIIKKNPEEEVRIKFIEYLRTKLDVPEEMLRTEIQMSKIKKGARGRADIMGLFYDFDKKEKKPLFIVECKAPHVVLIDRTFDQALRYAQYAPTVNTVILTNGNQTIFYIKEDGNFKRVNNIITYSEMMNISDIKVEYILDTHLDFVRPSINSVPKLRGKNNLSASIGAGSPKEHYKYLVNIVGLFKDFHSSPSFPIKSNRFAIIEDGYRFTSFGNAAGGSWFGDYRYFLLEDDQKQNQVISIAILAQVYKNENPRFPNAPGNTVLVVAIDDFDKSHNSLQLNLDNYVSVGNDSFNVWHDGRLTAGKKGALPRSAVINYIKEKKPEIIVNNRIHLGTLPYNRHITWNDAKWFLKNLIEYGLLRDEVRQIYN